VVSADPDALADRLRVAGELRGAGLRVRVDGSSRKLGKQLESMARHGVRWAVIVGEELTRGSVGVKDLETGEQHEVALNAVVSEVGGS
jgi:histidyl-tRNA synthetase